MNPLARKRVETALLDELRLCAGGAAPTRAFLRQAIGCSPAELAGAVQSLRYQGKMLWDRLELSSSMIEPELNAGMKHPPDASPSSIAGEEPAPKTAVAPIAEEGGAAAAKVTSPPSIAPGPDDEDDEDYPGGVNDSAEEAVEGPQGNGALPGEGEARDGADLLRHEQPAVPERGVEEPRSARAADQPAGAGQFGQAASARAAAGAPVDPRGERGGHNAHQFGDGFVPKRLLHKAGLHAANTRAAGKPLPAPAHEPEIARIVREEVNEGAERRARARSTATVRQPLEVRKFGIPDLSFAEGCASLLASEPHDLAVAVNRKHPLVWRRVLLLARSLEQRPIQTLYGALEAGLDQLEQQNSQTEIRDVA